MCAIFFYEIIRFHTKGQMLGGRRARLIPCRIKMDEPWINIKTKDCQRAPGDDEQPDRDRDKNLKTKETV